MTTTTNYPGTEPTLYDVIDIMQSGFARIEHRLDVHDGMFAELKQELHGVKQRLFKVELRLEDVADAVHGHEKRIIVLERWKKNMGATGLAGA